MARPTQVLATTIETAVNGYLRLDPETEPQVAVLAGKIIAIELNPPQLTLFFLPGAGGIRVMDACEQEADVTIKGTPLALLQSLAAEANDISDLEISGDTHVGRAFQNLLRSVDFDWEDYLSRGIGDVAAHQVGNAWRNVKDWGEQAVTSLLADASEYLRYERRDVPSQEDVARFLDEVDTLRDDVERLDARLNRIQNTLDA